MSFIKCISISFGLHALASILLAIGLAIYDPGHEKPWAFLFLIIAVGNTFLGIVSTVICVAVFGFIKLVIWFKEVRFRWMAIREPSGYWETEDHPKGRPHW